MTGLEGTSLTASGAATYAEDVTAALSGAPNTPLAQPTFSSLHDAPPLETSFEDLLRSSGIMERVIQNIRAQEITTRPLFAGDTTKEGFLDTCKSFGVDAIHGFRTKENCQSYSEPGTQRVQHGAKVQADSVARAHCPPVNLLEADWAAVLRGFREK